MKKVPSAPTLAFDVKVWSTRRADSSWMAYTEPFGLVLLSDTEEKIKEQLTEAVALFATSCSLPERVAYLTRHGVDFTVTLGTPVTGGGVPPSVLSHSQPQIQKVYA